MATIQTKLKQLRNADVRFISLVDRAATRIPFRVLKRNKENSMGIDLTSVFKSEAQVPPHVSAVVVFAQKNEAAGKQIAEAIKAHGFITDRVQKSDEGETLVFSQGDQPKDTVVVRLSDQMLVSVAGLGIPEGWVGDLVEEHGFFPDLAMANAAMEDRLQEVVTKSEAPQQDAQAVLTSYAQYVSQMAVLPTAVFKLDEAIRDIVQKCACQEPAEKTDDASPTKKIVEKAAGTTETDAEKAKRVKNHPPAEMAPPDEDDDQKPPPDEVNKSDESAILTALKGIETTVSGLSAKLETVVTEQVAQKKVLDDVVQKSDTLATTLKSTVTAPPLAGDHPAGLPRMRVEKQDTDPRTGNFDTAFLRRRR